MNRTKIKNYAPQARRDFLQAVTDRAAFYGLTADRIEPVTAQGDLAIIGGQAFPREIGAKRKALQERVERDGFGPTMEALAYTWFNRLVAIRYMELHGYLEHGYRVLSNPDPAKSTPEILDQAEHVELPDLKREQVVELKLDGAKEAELYRMLLVAQCNALHSAMPFLFERIGDETELVLPESLLHSDSIVRKLVSGIDEEDWKEVEVIGWLYQFYISEKKDAVIGKVVASEDIPAATQLFTPNWIVKYLVQNTLGRHWMTTYPQSPLKGQMKYYIEPAEQTPEVQEQLRAITPTGLDPEEITFLDPACGSAHILVEAYDLFKAIYQERGYRPKDIARLILSKNLFGLEIDDRAAQLAAFAMMMKARADDRRIFESKATPNILAFQDSQGMNAEEITHTLNSPLNKEETPREFLFEEIEEADTPLFGKRALDEKRHISQSDIASILALFEKAKTIGSLIQVSPKLAAKLPEIEGRLFDVLKHGDLTHASAHALKPLLQQARLLVRRYEVVVANPPYMGGRNGMNSLLKGYAERHYPATKADLFACFIERGFQFAKPLGHNAMVTMQSWMFLSSFEEFRERILKEKTLLTMAHLGPRAFGSISGEVVQATAFAFVNVTTTGFKPTFFRLVEGEEEAKNADLLLRNHRFSDKSQEQFLGVPGSPLAYWMPARLVQHLAPENQLLHFSDQRQGLATGDDDRFLRYWHEIDITTFNRINHVFPNDEQRWLPFIKGGSFRKWYGNNEFVIRFDRQSFNALGMQGNCLPNKHLYMKESLVWSDVAASIFGARFNDAGKVFGTGALSAFPKQEGWKFYILGYLNSCIHDLVINSISSGLHYHTGYVSKSPLLLNESMISDVAAVVEEAIAISRNDWNSFENSWDFVSPKALQSKSASSSVAQSTESWQQAMRTAITRLKELEEANNALFLKVYGLEADLSPQVKDKDITLSNQDITGCIRSIVSFAIGCTMGRYSLDTPGLIYAHGGNIGFDPGQYQTFPADPDGIVPVMEADWFADDATNRLVEFLGVAWPREGLDENLKFVADALGPNKGEQPRDTIRRYLATGFFKHHLQTYKRRPIYWLFSSGKQRAFQCLVYLHRYHDGTLARMRTEYVIPLQGKLASRIDQLAGDIPKATSTSHRKTLTQERDKLIKQQAELQAYDEKLRHYADMRIALDLDDGVKVNYGKFGDLLAEVKAVTGGREED